MHTIGRISRVERNSNTGNNREQGKPAENKEMFPRKYLGNCYIARLPEYVQRSSSSFFFFMATLVIYLQS
jgi:hypothetical protein